jgi:hypothetical protein
VEDGIPATIEGVQLTEAWEKVIKKIWDLWQPSTITRCVLLRIESDELDVLTIDELQNNLLVHEQCMKTHVVEEHALKVTFEESLWERGRGHRGIRGGGGDKYSFNKSIVECYNYYI